MECSVCGSGDIRVIYEGVIRDGKAGNVTKSKYQMYQCQKCRTIWHDHADKDYDAYYASGAYRMHLEGSSKIHTFYKNHDAECLDKFIYTGTKIFRDKVVADLGCGGGSFADYIHTVAKKVLAVEPCAAFHSEMKKKGLEVFSYAADMLNLYRNNIDVIVSFDVIEHVDVPRQFLQEIFDLLKPGGGCAYIGTPTDAPVMRELLGEEYESFLFTTQHPWIFHKKSFEELARSCGITNYQCNYYQRYGLGNLLYWLMEKKPGGRKQYPFITKAMDQCWKAELEEKELSDYMVFEFQKL